MSYHIEKDFVVCSNELLPIIKTYCRDGFYVSVPFTAKEYYVVVKSPGKEGEKGKFVVYKVVLPKDDTDTKLFYYVEDDELVKVIETLKKASEQFEKSGSKGCDVLGRKGEEVRIKDVDRLDEETIERMNQVRAELAKLMEERLTSKEASEPINYRSIPEDIRPYVDLAYRPNVCVYPDVKNVEIKLGKIVGLFRSYGKKCPVIGEKGFEKLMIPKAPLFNTELYKVVASAEILNRCSNESLKRHVECYLKYKVSRRVRYG